jgi:hypothetical protein
MPEPVSRPLISTVRLSKTFPARLWLGDGEVCGGESVWPAEVEAASRGLPGVADDRDR